MFYALIGIPMFIFCQFNIGSSMANVFRFLYSKVCCGYCGYVKRRNLKKRASTITSVVAKHAASITYAITNPKNPDEQSSQITTDPSVNPQEMFEEKTSPSSKKITVPISITLFVLIGYLVMGGVLFKVN
jgi:potassium channel subfamily K, invertebrate